MKIGVLASADSWHYRDLVRAAGSQHQIVALSFDDLATTFGNAAPAFTNKTVDLLTLDRVLVRTMPSGSLQQIIFRMDLLRQLEAAGVAVINPPRSIEMAVDKYLSLSTLAESGVSVPPTAGAESLDSAMACFDRLGGDVIYKPIFGSMGRGIARLTDREHANRFFSDQIDAGQIVYLQKFVDHGGWDLRVLLLGDSVFSIKRTCHEHWLTNVAQGGIATAHAATEEEITLARQAAAVTGCRIAGVDLFYDRAIGVLMVCEVNASPGWKATAQTLNADIGSALLEAIEA